MTVMKHRLMRHHFLLLIVVMLFLIWLIQQYFLDTSKPSDSLDDMPELSWNVKHSGLEKDIPIHDKVNEIHHSQRDESLHDVEQLLTESTQTGHAGRDVKLDEHREKESQVAAKIVTSSSFAETGHVNDSSVGNLGHVGNSSVDNLKAYLNDDSSRETHVHPTASASSKTAQAPPVGPVKEIVKENMDYSARDNLALVEKMAQKNFVRVNASHSHVQVDTDIGLSRRLKVHNFTHPKLIGESSSINTNLQNSKIFEGQNDRSEQVQQPLDELERFAVVASHPDYDLPVIGAKVNTPLDEADQMVAKPTETVFKLPGSDNITSFVLPENVDVEDGDSDDVMSSATVLGKLKPDKMYAVFSSTTENREALNFIFLLPLTALAWKRIGFESIVIVVGSVDTWNSDEIFHFVLSSLRDLGAVVVFLEPRPEKSVMISQISRIFVANILRSHAAIMDRSHLAGIDNIYVITSDTDIWPIYGDAYQLPDNKDILSLNSECCGAFSHRNVAYRMLPMANVGMRVGMWRKLTRRFGQSPRSVDDILTCVVREFGPVALRPVHKGDNVGWFLDQMMVSLLITSWTEKHGAERVKFVPRDVGVDRLDRGWWGPGANGGIDDRIDAHLLHNAYLPGVWSQLLPLIRSLYGGETERYLWCMHYYDSFQKLFIAKYRTGGNIGDS